MTEAVTPLVATMLTGVSDEAVRQAAVQGRVRTRAVLSLTGRDIRLLDLQSVLDCWEIDRGDIEADINLRLVHSLDIDGLRVVAPAMWLPPIKHEPAGADDWHDEHDVWPVWSRS